MYNLSGHFTCFQEDETHAEQSFSARSKAQGTPGQTYIVFLRWHEVLPLHLVFAFGQCFCVNNVERFRAVVNWTTSLTSGHLSSPAPLSVYTNPLSLLFAPTSSRSGNRLEPVTRGFSLNRLTGTWNSDKSQYTSGILWKCAENKSTVLFTRSQ